MNENGKRIAVWVDGTAPEEIRDESEAFLEQLYHMKVDMFTSDFPVRSNSFLQ